MVHLVDGPVPVLWILLSGVTCAQLLATFFEVPGELWPVLQVDEDPSEAIRLRGTALLESAGVEISS